MYAQFSMNYIVDNISIYTKDLQRHLRKHDNSVGSAKNKLTNTRHHFTFFTFYILEKKCTQCIHLSNTHL